MRNEPNLPPAALGPAGPIARHRLDAPLRETKPIAPLEGVGREPVLSLPKERPTHEEPRAGRAKQTQFAGCGSRIADSGAPGRRLRLAGPGASCTNKPNSAGCIVRNEPNSTIADWGLSWSGMPLGVSGPGGGCTNKPNWLERVMQNEANHRQSLPPHRRGMPMPQLYPTPRPTALENSLASKAAGG